MAQSGSDPKWHKDLEKLMNGTRSQRFYLQRLPLVVTPSPPFAVPYRLPFATLSFATGTFVWRDERLG